MTDVREALATITQALRGAKGAALLSIAPASVAAALSLSLAGCKPPSEQSKSTAEQVGQSENEASHRTASVGALGRNVTRDQFESRGLKWPLTVDHAELGCTKLSRWAEVDGVKYALNGIAEGQGYRKIDPVWQVDERMAEMLKEAGAENDPPIRVSIGDMLEEAGRHCS